MVLNAHRNRLNRDGEGAEEGYGDGGRGGGIIYLSLLCHHQNDSCIKKLSDESTLFSPFFLHISFCWIWSPLPPPPFPTPTSSPSTPTTPLPHPQWGIQEWSAAELPVGRLLIPFGGLILATNEVMQMRPVNWQHQRGRSRSCKSDIWTINPASCVWRAGLAAEEIVWTSGHRFL